MADWSPDLYARFMDERTRPARDLLAQVPPGRVQKVVDMGCGPGNSTALLAERFPSARITGLDSSPAMLEAARTALPHLSFALADASVWLPDADTDLVFANAIYQWVPDHLEVLPRVLAALPPGACLAVQMPDNLGESTHRLMAEVANEGAWAARLSGAARSPLPPVRTYYDALRPVAATLDIWHSVYNHVLASPEAVVDWVRGTGLRPFLEPLDPAEQVDFLRRYTSRIIDSYPPTTDGQILLRFPRLFIVATRAS